jgi:transposase-like protein
MQTKGSLPASTKRARVAELLEAGMSQAEIGRHLGLSKPTVSYHARRLGLPANDSCARRYDWAEIQRAHDEGMSMRACSRRFGFSPCSWSAAVKRGAIRPHPKKMPIEELLVDSRPQTNRSHLKQRLLAEGLKENACERCGISEWRGNDLSLALHHVNGSANDNRLENLELFCPNCHAQTENFAGRNPGRRGRQTSMKMLIESV